jgi:hypothetical protein
LSATSSVSPDASCFGVSDDDTAGFVPAVGGPRNDANFLVALDADSETAGASAGFWGGPASGEEPSVKGAAPPVLAPKPEKLPNFWGTPGCWWHCFNVSGEEVGKGLGHTVDPGWLTSATAGLLRLGRPRILQEQSESSNARR